jgi:hypothetical protein
MATASKKNTDVAGTVKPAGAPAKAAAGAQEPHRSPQKVFRVEDVSASIFSREHNGRTYYGVSFTRGYKDSAGDRKYSKYFDADDLGKVVTVAQQSAEYLHDLMQPEAAK